MKIHQILFCCFFVSAAVHDGNSGLVEAKILIHPEGGSLTAVCSFSLPGRRKSLCKDSCEGGNVLVETAGDAAQRGRYSIAYRGGTFPVSSTLLVVRITQLMKSDSGRYWCALERPFFKDSYREFELRVTDAEMTFPETLKQPEQQQTEETASAAVHSLQASRPGYLLPLGLCVTVLFAAVVLLLYKWKTSRNPGGLNTWRRSGHRNSRSTNMECATCKTCAPGSRCSDSTTSGRDETGSHQEKIYCNI